MATSLSLTARTCSIVLGMMLSSGISACETTGGASGADTDILSLGTIFLHAIGGIGSSTSVPREHAAAIPYASLGVRLGGSDEALFVLASKSGDGLMWLGGTNLGIVTRHGRVIRTVGFSSNLSGVHFGQGVKPDLTQPSADYLYDFGEQSLYGIPVKCARQNVGPEKIVIIGVPRDTTHVAEDCIASGMDWSFRNEFWVDPAGYVWKSRQFVAPKLDPLTFEVLRPAAE